MKVQQNLPINILLADDDKDDRFFFGKAVQKISIPNNLQMVFNGEQLIDHLSANSEYLPDVLFLDLNMPRKNGHECLIEIKADKRLKQIPVIIYSTSLSDETANALYHDGAHYFLQKRNLSELAKSIQQLFELLWANGARPPREKFILQ